MININLLPKHLRKKAAPDWWRTAAIVVPIVVLGVVAYFSVTTLNTIYALTAERDQLKAEVEVLKPYIREQRLLERKKKELEQIAQVAREVKATFKPWSDYLAAFLRQLPARGDELLVSLSAINARTADPNRALELYGIPAQVEFGIRGEAASDQALIKLVQAFEEAPNFGINFQSANYDKETGIYSFSASVGMLTEEQNAKEAGNK